MTEKSNIHYGLFLFCLFMNKRTFQFEFIPFSMPSKIDEILHKQSFS